MVVYRMNLSEEKKDAAVEIALMSPGNVRRRRICGPLLVVTGILLLICAAMLLLIGKADIQSIVFLIVGIAGLLLGLKIKAFQHFVLRKSEHLVDKAFRSGVVEYIFDEDGVHIESQVGSSLCYWDSFVECGSMGQYLYLKRGDNRIILVDKNDLTEAELTELTGLLERHINR